MNKTDKYKLKDALEHALFLLNESETLDKEPEAFNWDEAPVICELNSYRWLLGPEADEELTLKEAKNWCESVGGELPLREILLLAYLNESIKPSFKECWYWSSTVFNAATAWIQDFGNGDQLSNGKTSGTSVRAVRKVLI